MGMYRYIAARPATGSIERGELTADSPYHVRVALRRMGLLPTAVSEIAFRHPRLINRFGPLHTLAERVGRSRRSALLIELFEGLATLVATGTPIAAALDIMAGAGSEAGHPAGGSSSSRAQARLCRHLSEQLKRGQSLAGAMGDGGGAAWFSPIDIALVRVGEHNGSLDQCLVDLAAMHAQRDQTRGQLASALAYPGLLLAFGLGVVVFLTTTTLPKLAAVLTDANVEVPAATRVLLAVGHALTDRWYLVLAGLAATVILGAMAMTSVRFASLRLRVPLLGRVLLRAQLGEASRLLSALTRSGVPLTEALTLVAPSVRNPAIRRVLTDVAEHLHVGKDVGACLRHSGVLEPVFCRVLEVAQESGEMAQALATIGERYRVSAARLTDRLARVLEPAVILILAALVGGVVYAAITPMLRLGQTITS